MITYIYLLNESTIALANDLSYKPAFQFVNFLIKIPCEKMNHYHHYGFHCHRYK